VARGKKKNSLLICDHAVTMNPSDVSVNLLSVLRSTNLLRAGICTVDWQWLKCKLACERLGERCWCTWGMFLKRTV